MRVSEVVISVAVTYFGFGMLLAALVSLIGIRYTGWYSPRSRWVLVGLAGVVVVSGIADMFLSMGSLSTQIIRGAWDVAFIGTIAAMVEVDRRHDRSVAEPRSALLRTGWSLLAAGVLLVAISVSATYFG